MTRYLLIAALTVVLGACDQTFEPFQESDSVLSLFGFLDVAADTQWVRVTPIRSSIFTEGDSLDTTVTLENLRNGKIVELRESIFRHVPLFVDSAAVQFAHAFWTTEKIDPQGRYRLHITRPDGHVVAATAVTPPDFNPVIRQAGGRVSVRVAGEHLAIVNVRCTGDLRIVTSPLNRRGAVAPFEIQPPINGVYDVTVNRSILIEDSCPVVNSSIQVVTSGDAWPRGRGSSTSSLLMASPENITNGLGFFGGVLSKIVPWETCILSPNSGPCDLVFDKEVVRVEGRVIDARCGTPVTTADVRLSEVLPPPVRLFSATVDSLALGFYKFDLLRPNRRYALRVTSEKRTIAAVDDPSVPIYGVFEDTLSFQPSQRAIFDVRLPRLVRCPGERA